ncbi:MULTISPECIES: hypothetical protein [unclassified Gordonia (in: high G+C Gram-positive bacteria)]
MSPERFLAPAGADDRADAVAFLSRAMRLDEAAVIRLSARADGLVALWAHTGFDVLVTRSVFGTLAPDDVVCDAATIRSALARGDGSEPADPGMPLDSAWRGALPARVGYRHLDDVPARTVVDVTREGARLAREEGSNFGPATGLLDQGILEVSTAEGGLSATVSLRSLFALTAMGFVRDGDGHEVTETSPTDAIAASEPVRIRLSAAWIRIDARFGSVYQRRHRDLGVTVL